MSNADPDNDSQMHSSPSSTSSTTTSPTQSTVLEPQQPQSTRSSTSMPAGANANGKRPINHISNGGDNEGEEVAQSAVPQQQHLQQPQQAQGAMKPRPDFPTKTHERSGYSWSREEDAPGFSWGNKKAVDEFHRAWDGLVHREGMIKGRYGDPFDMADREQAMLNSLTQK